MFYRQTIIIFCMVVPITISAIILGAGSLGIANVTQSFELKKQKSKNNEMSTKSKDILEKQITQEKDHYNRWKQLIAEETTSSVATALREIIEKLPSKEIQQTAFERPNTVGGFASQGGQKASTLRISFRGTYRTLQKALLQLETELPQLQLQDMKIDPVGGRSNLINLQVTYTAWELES